ncbi:dihydroorotate dehydrogenase electron transfer subunit [Lentisphaerota bacterium WC36G]|nr:dihydroorotate dehydrogenase electron transfer subunit [Lentisphaerae bacterium WC36]
MPEVGEILKNEVLKGDYYKVVFYVPEICKNTKPGQFVHVKIANLRDRILRRPFSICDVDVETGELTVAYKIVGEGTKVLATLEVGTVCDLMGPLGVSFTPTKDDEFPVIVAGGYGSAATHILAKQCVTKGVLLLGARSEDDLILMDKFEEANFEVRLSTNDGSVGHQGLVTELVEQIIAENTDNKKLRFYGCGPTPMLMALGKMLEDKGYECELSLDHLMCCGVGACFACVVKVKANNEDGWRYARTCNEGPVFNSKDVYYG